MQPACSCGSGENAENARIGLQAEAGGESGKRAVSRSVPGRARGRRKEGQVEEPDRLSAGVEELDAVGVLLGGDLRLDVNSDGRLAPSGAVPVGSVRARRYKGSTRVLMGYSPRGERGFEDWLDR
jgi:hypothetical protein